MSDLAGSYCVNVCFGAISISRFLKSTSVSSVRVWVSQLHELIGEEDFSKALEGSNECQSYLVWKSVLEGDLGLFQAAVTAIATSDVHFGFWKVCFDHYRGSSSSCLKKSFASKISRRIVRRCGSATAFDSMSASVTHDLSFVLIRLGIVGPWHYVEMLQALLMYLILL